MVAGLRRRSRELQARVLQPGAQRGADAAAVVVPAVEPAQLDPQQRRLERVEPRGRADHAVVVARALAVRAEQADTVARARRRR